MLGIQNGVFTIDGQKNYLLFASYFGALRDAVLHPDWLISILNSARLLGFDGIRVFPTWWSDPPNQDLCGPTYDPYPLILGDGSINPQVAGAFQFLLDMAWEKGLVVDLSFAPETVSGLWNRLDRDGSLLRYRAALSNLAAAMRTASYPGNPGLGIPAQTGYKHAFFDVANESNHSVDPECKPRFTQSEIAYLLAGVRAGDPGRLGTASTTGGVGVPDGEPVNNWGITSQMTADLVAYHEPRAPYSGTPQCPGAYPWHVMTRYRTAGFADCAYSGYRQVTADTIPIYFGEEERHRYLPESGCNQFTYLPDSGCNNNYTWNQFVASAVGAKEAGAAGWTWHTTKLFRYFSNYSPGLTEVEVNVVYELHPQLHAPGVTWPR